MKHEKFEVTGMTCSACSSRVEKAVSQLPGINKASVNLLTNSMQVDFDDSVLSEQDIINAVIKAGYEAFVTASSTAQARPVKNSASSGAAAAVTAMKKRLI
mgnify:CR=1 FL=1